MEPRYPHVGLAFTRRSRFEANLARKLRHLHCMDLSLASGPEMRTLLICHADDSLNETGLARWLASFSDLRGIVVIHEPSRRIRKRVRREIKRVGVARFPDVLAFRLYYRLVHATRDRHWEEQRLHELCAAYPPLSPSIPVLHTPSPNTSEGEAFVRTNEPDVMIARCKTLLKDGVFSIPSRGTFVMHPGICPEYRNAHG